MDRFADSHIHMTLNEYEPSVQMLDMMAEKGVTDTTIHSLTYRGINYNLKALYWKQHYTRMKLRAFGMLHDFGPFATIDPVDEVRKLLAMGCDGIKMLEMDPLLRKLIGTGVNNPHYDPMFTYLEDNNIPVCMHVNDPETFWDAEGMTPERVRRGWFYGDGTYPSKEQIYQETFAMLDKHPRLRVTFAHFFFMSNFLERAEEIMEKYPNVRFDLTPGGEMYVGFSKRIEDWQQFFIKYQDRILFGTDSNNHKGVTNERLNRFVKDALLRSHDEFVPDYNNIPIRGLALPQEAYDKITYSNYVDFVGAEPKPVNTELCRQETAWMLRQVESYDYTKQTTKYPEQWETSMEWLLHVQW